MKLLKEIGFRCFIVFVMISLALVANDMSQPVLLSEQGILVEDVVECIVQADDVPGRDYNFTMNILLPIVAYFASIAGFLYLLVEDLKLLKTFSRQNKLARTLWLIWIIVLMGMLLIPIFFGFQLLQKGFVLAFIATGIFLILLGILFRLSSPMKKQQKP